MPKMGIDHDQNEFVEGQEYVMTLKDENVLDAMRQEDDDFAEPGGPE